MSHFLCLCAVYCALRLVFSYCLFAFGQTLQVCMCEEGRKNHGRRGRLHFRRRRFTTPVGEKKYVEDYKGLERQFSSVEATFAESTLVMQDLSHCRVSRVFLVFSYWPREA